MKKYISKFHYLTQDLRVRSHLKQVTTACEAGANWIQYRCLTKPDDELIEEINEIADVCDNWGATLILTNHYHLLNKVDAQGVHIEDFDADLKEIRTIIGKDKTLGASATNIKRLLDVQETGVVDYCGYGPFAHTDTKPNNKPLLGYEGYRLLQHHPEIEIPVIAVGGIHLIDVNNLMETGIFGIAVSAAINMAFDPGKELKAFYHQIY
ncbi:thiamine phosphate synthase [Mucilaginibacter sp.]|uniref:thiamine phosphate synthase n=1 Tax=Mucilaginibacter sp. TaxID=1882438 RepID=UPI003D0F3C93